MDYKKAIFAGSFDPFTNGHFEIVKKASQIFQQITILFAVSPDKTPFFPLDDRIEALEKVFRDYSQVKIDFWSGLIAQYAKENNMGTIIRGLRPEGDFVFEYQMASMNNKLLDGLETVFLLSSTETNFISSSLVKEIFKHGKDVSQFVPQEILMLFQSREKL
jgi:pantetheine-phosphate adenylyltransferase